MTAALTFGRVLMEFKRWVLLTALEVVVVVVEEKCWRRSKDEEIEALVRIVCVCVKRARRVILSHQA